MPEPVGVIVRAQLEVVAFTAASVQGDPVNDPVGVAVPVLLTATVPAGALAVPAVAMSLTNVVQVTVWPVVTDVGEHVTIVDVGLSVTVTVLPAVGPLPLWAASDEV